MLLIVVITLGATGFSDRMMGAVVGEEVRGLRQSLAQDIRDPTELERVLLEKKIQLEEFYGLDQPWYSRLPDMVLRILTLNLGESTRLRSFQGSNSVSDIVLERIPNTIILVTTSLAITAIIGLIVGSTLASKVGTKIDRTASYLSVISYALPAWWTGIILIFIFAFQLRLLPSGGLLSSPPPIDPIGRFVDTIYHAILPILTLVLVSLGGWIYTVRTLVLNTAQEDFVTVARAKGLPEGLVRRRYILRVTAPPILTGVILGLANSFAGAILTETVFSWPGMGLLYYNAILAPDESVIVALTFMFTLIYVFSRFILEVLYIIVDPRVKYN